MRGSPMRVVFYYLSSTVACLGPYEIAILSRKGRQSNQSGELYQTLFRSSLFFSFLFSLPVLIFLVFFSLVKRFKTLLMCRKVILSLF